MFRKLSLILVTLLVVFPLGVNALGLGEIKLKSGLNQPLRAEITLFSPEGMSEFEVSASLASLNEFDKAGIDYFGYLKNIRFKTVKGPGDSLYVEVSTREPIKEPFLNFLVELNWPKGRMLREYTLLLDPPVFTESRSATVQTPKQVTRAPQTQPATQTRAPTRSTPASQPTITGSTYGPVGEAETLWRIATGVKPANASIHQTLVALYRANPNAFVNGNIHLLKKGSTLVIPDAQSITSTPKRAALQDMVARLRGDRETVLDTTGRSSSNNRATRGEDRLRLATPGEGTGADRSGTGGSNSADVRRLKDELAQTKEAAATLEAENEELRRKLQDALTDLEEQQKGKVGVDSEVGAAIANQDDLVNEQVTDSVTEETSPETNTDSLVDDSADSASSTGDSTSADATSDAVDSTDVTSSSDDNVQDTQRLSDSAGGSTNNVTTSGGLTSPPQEESWMDNPLYFYGVIVLLGGLVIAFVVFWRMRQRMSDDEFQDDLVVSAQGSNFDTEDAFDMPDTGDDLLDDLSEEDVFEEDGSTEADPLGEADIYIAYGKYDQAEKLLTDAISEQPDRNDLKLKLLECHAENKDRGKFDAAEQEFSDSFFGDAEATAQMQEIKNNAWPEDAGDEDDFELPSTEEIFGEDNAEVTDSIDDFSLDDLDSDTGMSLDDDFSTDDVSGEEADFDTDDMDFDIGEPEADTAEVSLDDSFSDSALDDTSLDDSSDEFSLDDDLLNVSEDDSDLSASDDLDLDLDSSDTDNEISLDDDLDMNLDDDFDLGDDDDLDGDMMDGTDEASTKLDLARAYIDMGDIDGAKEILNEVIEEGGESHKSEALALLEKI